MSKFHFQAQNKMFNLYIIEEYDKQSIQRRKHILFYQTQAIIKETKSDNPVICYF